MSKYDIRPDFECQNRVLNVKIQHSAQFQGQNRIRMSKYDIPPDFECGNRILNVKLRYSAQVRMSKKDYECYIFSLNSNVKIGF